MSTAKYDTESPIIDLFKILMLSDMKEITILRNSKLIEILEKEFCMVTSELHMFEVDIYMNVLKKYLKTWPGWENFDENIINIKTIKDNDVISKFLNKEYVKLKEYLRNLLNLAQVLAADKVNELKLKEKNTDHLVMEVEATRQQLNNLFYRAPVQNSIFNISNNNNRHFNTKNLTLDSIFNFCGVQTIINLKIDDKYIIYERRCPHRLKHTLKNNKLVLKTENNNKLQQNILMKSTENSITIQKSEIVKYIEEIDYDLNGKSIFYNDLSSLPDILKVPCSYRRSLSEYNYVRYLYCDIPVENSEKYDLVLEEKMSPMWELNISISPVPCVLDIKISCSECHVTFSGVDVSNVLEHFKQNHEDPDWTCTKCAKVCSTQLLTRFGWKHTCD